MYRGLIGDIMVINNQADVEEIEGIEFINRIPLHMQQIMANISRMLNDGWHMRDRRTKNDFEQLLKFFKGSDRLEAIVMDTVTWKQTEIEEETLTILQVLILRFINVHLCNLLEYLTQRDIQTKNSGVNVRYRGKHRFFKGFNEFIKEKTRRCDNDFEKIERHVFF